MPYLGSTPNASFSTRTKQDFTANGSTTAFTLSSAVASPNDIEVFVGNVRQEPTDAYSVSGTTLTMSEAPATGLNFYVVFKGLEENSVVPADNTISSAKLASNLVLGGDLTVDDDFKFISGSVPKLGIGTLTPNRKLVVSGNNSSGAEISLTNTDMTANKRTMNFYMSGDKANMRILNDAGSAGTNAIEFNNSGHITMPNQPAFMAYKNGNQSLTAHTLTKITGWTEATDQSNSWDNGAGTFTAPSAGIYLFGILMQSNVNGGLHLMVRKNGNNGLYGDNYLDGGDLTGSSYTILMPMVANDYVEYLAYLTVNGNINSNRSKVWAVKVA